MIYTVQAKLDEGDFGKMWGCTFLGPANCCEHTRERIATRKEMSLIIGEAFRTISASMSNYKHCGYVRPKKTPPKDWGSKSNPEWHYLVEHWGKLLNICEDAMNVKVDLKRFEIALMWTQYKTNHYCIRADGEYLINPDPSLYGRIKSYRKLA